MEVFNNMQKQMDGDVAEIKRIENEYRKVVANKQIMTDKKTENEMVLTEFGLLEENSKIYKLVGPILAEQNVDESKSNVTKRVEFIEREIARLTTLEADF